MKEEQIEKQLEWLEKERRQDKETISKLQKQIKDLEDHLERTNQGIQALETEQTKFGVRITKMDSYDDALSAHRKEVKKELSAAEKRAKKREDYAKKKFEDQVNDLNKNLAQVEQTLAKLKTMQESIDGIKRDNSTQDNTINKFEATLNEIKDKNLDIQQSMRLVEEDATADKKRLNDVQGEVTALRKRLEENRALYDLANEAQKKMDTRLNELIAAEDERRENQRHFVEEVSRSKMEVEKSFAEWTKRFSSIEERAETLTSALQTYSEIEVSLRRAQSEFDSIIEQISRRIHEITEMQRLGEDRFRQEWTTFKSDDQKRWVNYTLTQEEQNKENTRRYDRMNERLTTMEELLQDMQDIVEQNSEQMENLMQGFSSVLGDWLSANDRSGDTR